MSLHARTATRLAATAALWRDEGAGCDQRIREWALEPTSDNGTPTRGGGHSDPTSTARPNRFGALKSRWDGARNDLAALALPLDAQWATVVLEADTLTALAHIAKSVRNDHAAKIQPATLRRIIRICDELEWCIWEATPIPIDVANDMLRGKPLEPEPEPACFACLTPITARTRSRLCEPCRNWRKVLTARDPDALDDAVFAERVRLSIRSGASPRPDSPLNPGTAA